MSTEPITLAEDLMAEFLPEFKSALSQTRITATIAPVECPTSCLDCADVSVCTRRVGFRLGIHLLETGYLLHIWKQDRAGALSARPLLLEDPGWAPVLAAHAVETIRKVIRAETTKHFAAYWHAKHTAIADLANQIREPMANLAHDEIALMLLEAITSDLRETINSLPRPHRHYTAQYKVNQAIPGLKFLTRRASDFRIHRGAQASIELTLTYWRLGHKRQYPLTQVLLAQRFELFARPDAPEMYSNQPWWPYTGSTEEYMVGLSSVCRCSKCDQIDRYSKLLLTDPDGIATITKFLCDQLADLTANMAKKDFKSKRSLIARLTSWLS